MRPLANQDFNPLLPLQTKPGAAQALRCGVNNVDKLIKKRVLKTVELPDDEADRRVRITTESILAAAKGEAA